MDTSKEASKDKKKKVTKTASDGTHNTYQVIDTQFVMEKRYEVIDPIGQGAYGVVVAAKDLDVNQDSGEQ